MNWKVSSSVKNELRRIVMERDGENCHWCGCKTIPVPSGTINQQPNHATLDHHVPRCRGGSNDPSNIVLSCYQCNHDRGYQSESPPITENQLIALLRGEDI